MGRRAFAVVVGLSSLVVARAAIAGASLVVDRDVTLLGLYDPVLRTAGGQFQETIHIGKFLVVVSAGALYRRGAWGMFGLGTTFGI